MNLPQKLFVVLLMNLLVNTGVSPAFASANMTEREFKAEIDDLRQRKIFHGPEYANILENGIEHFVRWVCDSHIKMYNSPNFGGGHSPGYLWMIAENVKEKHKKLVLDCYKKAPQFVTVVEKNDWLLESRNISIAHIQNYPDRAYNAILLHYVEIARLDDKKLIIDGLKKFPEAFEHVSPFLNKHMEADEVYDLILELWNASFCDSCHTSLALAPSAIKYGVKDALRYTVFTLNSSGRLSREMNKPYGLITPGLSHKERLYQAIQSTTGFEGSASALVQWYEDNSDKLRFDKTTKTYRIVE